MGERRSGETAGRSRYISLLQSWQRMATSSIRSTGFRPRFPRRLKRRFFELQREQSTVRLPHFDRRRGKAVSIVLSGAQPPGLQLAAPTLPTKLPPVSCCAFVAQTSGFDSHSRARRPGTVVRNEPFVPLLRNNRVLTRAELALRSATQRPSVAQAALDRKSDNRHSPCANRTDQYSVVFLIPGMGIGYLPSASATSGGGESIVNLSTPGAYSSGELSISS